MWQPRELKLTQLNPPQARAGSQVKISARGEGFGRGVQLMLIREDGQGGLLPSEVIPCDAVQITEGKYELSFNLSLEGAETSRYTAVAWNPPLRAGDPSERYVLESAFTVTA